MTYTLVILVYTAKELKVRLIGLKTPLRVTQLTLQDPSDETNKFISTHSFEIIKKQSKGT